MTRCEHFGHMWDVVKQDEDYTYERCNECGKKERFCKHAYRDYYAKEHSTDMVQAWDERFKILYPDAAKRIEKEIKEAKAEEEKVAEGLERAKFELKQSSLTTKFVQ